MDVLAVVADRGQQLGDVVVVQLVANVAALAPPAHEPQVAKDPQVVRCPAQAQFRGRREFLDSAFGGEQLRKEEQPGRRTDRLQRRRELNSLVLLERPSGGGVFSGMRHNTYFSSYEQVFKYRVGAPSFRGGVLPWLRAGENRVEAAEALRGPELPVVVVLLERRRSLGECHPVDL
jgi:hypothetical protein